MLNVTIGPLYLISVKIRPVGDQPSTHLGPEDFHMAPESWKSVPDNLRLLSWGQAPVPLSIFRSNSKFDENSECSSFEYTRPITTIFCTRHDSDTVVTCAKYRYAVYFTLECFEFSSNFEFDRNMLSGTGPMGSPGPKFYIFLKLVPMSIPK